VAFCSNNVTPACRRGSEFTLRGRRVEESQLLTGQSENF
jgi:hypothetical protein